MWKSRAESKEEPYFDMGPLRHCKVCPHNNEGKPAPTMAEITVKCLALVLIEMEMKDREKLYGRMA